MKNNEISKKIKSSLRLIKDFKNKEMLITNDEAGNALKEHIKMYDHAVKLKNEIVKLQASLKFKKKEIASVVKELSKSRKITKKGLKKAKKSTSKSTSKSATALVPSFNNNQKPATRAVRLRRRSVDPATKTTKTRAKSKPSATGVKPSEVKPS